MKLTKIRFKTTFFLTSQNSYHKKGKKHMRQVDNLEIPQQAFMAVLKLND